MAKLTFDTEADDYREASKIELTIPNDMNITEFKVVCIRLASALGYQPKSIQKAFGKEETFEKEEGLKQLINELNIDRDFKGNLNQF